MILLQRLEVGGKVIPARKEKVAIDRIGEIRLNKNKMNERRRILHKIIRIMKIGLISKSPWLG